MPRIFFLLSVRDLENIIIQIGLSDFSGFQRRYKMKLGFLKQFASLCSLKQNLVGKVLIWKTRNNLRLVAGTFFLLFPPFLSSFAIPISPLTAAPSFLPLLSLRFLPLSLPLTSSFFHHSFFYSFLTFFSPSTLLFYPKTIVLGTTKNVGFGEILWAS